MDSKLLKERIDKHLADLAQLTSDAARSEAMQAYLETCARFHNYSPSNQFLIQLFKPRATFVAGYKRWQELGRQVRKGEKGIPILAPLIYRKDPEDEESAKVIRGFRTVYVWDVSQTDGDPLPPPPDWKSPAKSAELEAQLLAYAKRLGIKIEVKELDGETQGLSSGGLIELSPLAGTKTLLHELAHELLHQTDVEHLLPRPTKELEAEAVAFVVATHFGLGDLASPNYLALWDADAEKIAERADRIRSAACQIIESIDRGDK